jgi:hypothetical protein
LKRIVGFFLLANSLISRGVGILPRAGGSSKTLRLRSCCIPFKDLKTQTNSFIYLIIYS